MHTAFTPTYKFGDSLRFQVEGGRADLEDILLGGEDIGFAGQEEGDIGQARHILTAALHNPDVVLCSILQPRNRLRTSTPAQTSNDSQKEEWMK